MARREYDTSRARCNTCGKPYVAGDALYSVADKFDETIDDRDVLVSFRHWDCHTPTPELLQRIEKSLDDASDRVQGLLNELRSKLK